MAMRAGVLSLPTVCRNNHRQYRPRRAISRPWLRPPFFCCRGKAPADERVVVSLYQRALGYDHNGKHYPPDVTACIFWLKNRAPEEWRDRREEHHTIVQDNRTAAEIFADLQRDMAEMGLDL